MTAPLRIASMTTRQVLGLKRFLGLGALALLPGIVVYFSTARADDSSRLETFAGVTVGLFLSVVVPVVSLILSASTLGDERRDQTLSFIVVRPIARTGIAAGKTVGAIAAAGTVTGIGALTLGTAMGLRHGSWAYVVPLLVGALVATIAYAGLFTPLGYLTERATIAGLAFVFIWEGAVVGAVPGLAGTSPWRVGSSAFAGLAPDEVLPSLPDFALGSLTPGAGGSVVKALAIYAAGLALTIWILRTRDLT